MPAKVALDRRQGIPGIREENGWTRTSAAWQRPRMRRTAPIDRVKPDGKADYALPSSARERPLSCARVCRKRSRWRSKDCRSPRSCATRTRRADTTTTSRSSVRRIDCSRCTAPTSFRYPHSDSTPVASPTDIASCPRPASRLRTPDAWAPTMEAEGKVIPSFAARRAAIEAGLAKAAQGDRAIAPDALLDEVTSLVEWPVVHAGTFDPAFLSVPQECLILTMQQNQKYFALTDADRADACALPRREQPRDRRSAGDRRRQRAGAAGAARRCEVLLRPGPQGDAGIARSRSSRTSSTSRSSESTDGRSIASTGCESSRVRSPR